jgi:prepilin-type N-terminal cleavage/methylation domain-containing protein
MPSRRAGAGTVSHLPQRQRGFTLTELLVAALLSLVLMAAVATLFGLFSRAARHSQATANLVGLLRSAAWQLRQDLAGITCNVQPWLAPETNAGYFELIEGPNRDTSFALDGQGLPTTNLTADTDDILLFTTQALAEPFVGRFGDSSVESPFAEVAWFCRPLPQNQQPVAGTTLFNLHRRQLLVINYLGDLALNDNTLEAPSGIDRSRYDVSLRQVRGKPVISGSCTALFPNSLGDLTKRENRFLHGYLDLLQSGSSKFPYPFALESQTGFAHPSASLDGTFRAWEDVILTNVIAFDVRVYDPDAAPRQVGSSWILPGDAGYATPVPRGIQTGGYIDLGWSGSAALPWSATFPPTGMTAFQSGGQTVTAPPLNGRLPTATYDTWSRHYEFNDNGDELDKNDDEDQDGVVDEGTTSLDYTADAETSPPYPVPLRGIEVRIRCFEPVSKQVRQITIRHAFIR